MVDDILKKIVAHKKEEVRAAQKKIPQGELEARAANRAQRRSLWHRLLKPGPGGVNIIAEIKRASPSRGIIRGDLAAGQLAAVYSQAGAAAVSVLTDHRFFKGALDDLIQVRARVGLPVLRKDFMISAYQIYESAAFGADAVLLIVGILSGQQLKSYLDLCGELGLDALVEVYTEGDLETAHAAGARLIGINNRNLRSFDTDTSHAARLADRLDPGQLAVAASGIHRPEDMNPIIEAGIWNFLIGESLVRSDHPAALLGSLLTAGKAAAPGNGHGGQAP